MATTINQEVAYIQSAAFPMASMDPDDAMFQVTKTDAGAFFWVFFDPADPRGIT